MLAAGKKTTGNSERNTLSIDEITNATSSDLPIIDVEKFKHIYGMSDWKVMLEVFVQETPADIKQIRAALNASDRSKLLKDAHNLKGSCGTMCATILHTLCLQLEEAARSDDWLKATRLVNEIENQFDVLTRHVKQILFGGEQS